MKIAGRKLTGMTTLGLVVAGLAAGLAGIDYLRDATSKDYADHVASAVHLEQKDDMKAAYEGKLVWISGVPTGSSTVRDLDFNIDLPLLRLERHSEIFQWQQSGSKHKKYAVGWVERPIDSRDFRYEDDHRNTGSIAFPDYASEANSYRLGPAFVDRSYVARMPSSKVPVTKVMYDAMPGDVRSLFALSSNDDLVPGDEGHVRELKIGDNRTRFDGIYANPITVVGQYANGTVIPVDVGGSLVDVLVNENTTLEKIVVDIRSTAHSWTVVLGWLAAALLGLGVSLSVFDFASAEVELPPARFGR